METSWDAIVIGGGPGGSALATQLAHHDRRVLLLEREMFPRYHEGESLSPAAWTTLDRLGAPIRDEGFLPKPGATFVWGADRTPWTTAYGTDGDRLGLQVPRDRFDHLLLDHAAACGVEVRQGWRAVDVHSQNGRVLAVFATDPDGALHGLPASWVIDASGSDAVLANQFALRRYHPALRNNAVWSYWENGGVLPGAERGGSVLVGHEQWCFWYTPLDEATGRVAVGMVVLPGGQRGMEAGAEGCYLQAIRDCEVMSDLLAKADQVAPVRARTAYAYCAGRMAGPGWLLLGDAACSVDPILSAGAQAALQHSTLAAAVVNAVLDEPDLEERALAFYDRLYQSHYTTFVDLCLNLYAAPGAFRVGDGMPPQAADQMRFLSLVSGLPATELPGHLGGYFGARAKAALRGGPRPVPGEEEGFAFLTRRFHDRDLRSNCAPRMDGPLTDDSVVRLSAGAAVGESVFLPHGGVCGLVRRRVAVNRYGDRFEATRELEALFTVVPGGCRFAEARQRFAEILATEVGRDEFHAWLRLLAGHALVEWTRPTRCGAGTTAPSGG